ncbi:nitric oxide synthase oxygenase [Deinococcus sp. VB343]|uniref:Nitric oxide synthase oxygenase n=1 Tax=Deinococcus sp. VB142 TaxID=3112952 RepID=A0AAU6PYR8_9DEIO
MPAPMPSEVADFLTRYHAETGTPGLAARLAGAAGGWMPTPAELTWAAKVAWRNSTRCVGRLYWEALEVRDLRGLDTPELVYAALLEHLHDAFCGGHIRPVISVFGPGVRLHNSQLIRYADDPLNAEFVAHLARYGWQPSGARFEVLPLLIEAGGETRLFSLPPDAVQEVAITHPDCPGVGELGLRWHALPVISDMRLEVGGLHLPCAFNGWYVQTEIAARDLADTDRYDALPAVARALGLDTRRERTLWRDRALVELNVAVLHSFDTAGVKLVDHHTVTAHHVRFEEREARAGREVRGKWSWLIPPLSPATTPLWSRSYRGREESPRFVRPSGGCPHRAG